MKQIILAIIFCVLGSQAYAQCTNAVNPIVPGLPGAPFTCEAGSTPQPTDIVQGGAVATGATVGWTWSEVIGTLAVTSVQASGGTTGLTFSGGPVTTSGTLTLAGVLAAANGGTSTTSVSAAVVTSSTSVSNALSTWAGYLSGGADPTPVLFQGQSTSALAGDAAQASAWLNNPTLTAARMYSCAISANCATSVTAADAVRGIATNTAGTTTPFTIDGVAGYTLNNTAPASGQAVTAALFGIGICAVNNSNCWGSDTIVSDNLGLNTSAGTGRSLFGGEADLQITSTGTSGAGFQIGGTWLVQPSSAPNGFAVLTPWGACGTGPCSPFAKWGVGFITGNGAASIGMSLGTTAVTAAAHVTSQALDFQYYDSSSANQYDNLQADGFGNLIYTTSATIGNFQISKGALLLSTGNGVLINGNVILSADSGATASIGSGSSFTNINVGNTTAAVNAFGQVNLNTSSALGLTASTGFVGLPYTAGIPSGAPAASMNCAIDTSNAYLNCYWAGGWHKIAFSGGAG